MLAPNLPRSPAPADSGVMQCQMLRQRGKGRQVTYHLVSDSGAELLTATRRDRDFVICMPGADDGTVDFKRSQQRSFSVLKCPGDMDESRNFFAYRATFDGKNVIPVGGPFLAASHGTLMASVHLPQVNTMCVAFPEPSEGEHVLFDEQYFLAALKHMRDRSAAQRAGIDMGPDKRPYHRSNSLGNVHAAVGDGLCLMQSRVPVWNRRSESYVLNFHGRATLASSKNVQLMSWDQGRPHPLINRRSSESSISSDMGDPYSMESAEDNGLPSPGGSPSGSKRPAFLYGKVGPDLYNLDYQFPLSPLHAFVIALSVADW